MSTPTDRSARDGGAPRPAIRDDGESRPAICGLPPVDLVLRPPVAPPVIQRQVTDSTDSSAKPSEAPAAVDPKVLAERVYRLLRDEVIIARERE